MLSTQVTVATGAASAGAVAYAVRWVERNLAERKTVLMAVLSALVFALQMLNVPVAPGISGHFSGGAAAAIILGPWPAVIVMTTVVAVQAVVFQDGGVLAMGANVLNLAVLGPLAAYAIWSLVRGRSVSAWRRNAAAFAAAWVAVVVSALALAVQLWLSGRIGLAAAAGVLGGWHAVIGIGEGVITAGIVSFVTKTRPDVLSPAEKGSGRLGIVVLGAAALVASLLSWLASAKPDVLDSLARSSRMPRVQSSAWAPLARYSVAGVHNERLGTAIAAVVGLAVVAGVVFALAAATRWRASAAHAPELHRHGHVHATGPEHEHAHHHSEEDHDHAHTPAFERFTYIVSPVHALDPRTKVACALALIAGVVASPVLQTAEIAFVVALAACIALMAQVPFSAILKRSLVVLPVAVALALYAPLVKGGWTLAYAIVARAWLSAIVVVLLVATTRPGDLVAGLRRMGMPAVFGTTLTFLSRFTHVMAGQLSSVRRALESRAPSLRGPRLLPVYGSLAGSLVVRGYERGERVYSAMLSRGFTGEIGGTRPLKMHWPDWLTIAAALMTGAALLLY
jgi:cobalt/nickel transport system permease protein